MSKTLLDAEVLAKIEGLALQSRTIVDGLVTGLHRSRKRGGDIEFADHREYSPGDELRHIDWKVYARSGRYFVRRFEQDTTVRVQIALDCSRSMLVDTHGQSKLDYARSIAACLGYHFLRQGDAVGLVLFDDRIRVRIGEQGHMRHMHELLQALVRIEPGPDTNISECLSTLAAAVPRRQIVVLISDLIDDSTRVIDAVSHLHHRHHDLMVLQVLDPQEIRFDFHGGIRLRDLESGQTLELDADRARSLYRREAERLLAEYELRFRQKGIDYSVLETDTPLAEGLIRHLSTRESMHARH